MAAWAFHCFDVRTGGFVGSLDVASWSHTDRLNGSGEWSATLAPAPTAPLERMALSLTLEGRATIVPFRNGQPLGYTAWVPPGGRRQPELAGGSLLSLLDRQVIETDLVFAAAGQFAMAAALVDLAAAQDGALIDTSRVGTSAVLRDQTWRTWEGKSIGEALRQKSALINGFDFDVRSELDAGVIVRRLRCWHPRRGRIHQDHVTPDFVVGGNVLTVPAAAGSQSFVTHVVALGEPDPETRQRLVATQTSTALLAAGWPRITHTLDLSDVKELTTLQQHADGHIDRWGRDLTDELTLVVDPDDVTWPWGSWDLGDEHRMVIPAGRSPRWPDGIPWWPDGMTAIRRIIGHHWTHDAGGDRLEVITKGPVDVSIPTVVVPPVVIPLPPDPEPPPDPPPAGEGYVDFPGTTGNYLSVPDAAALDIVGDLCVVCKIAAYDYTPGAQQVLVSKWVSAGNQRSYELRLEPSGALTGLWTTAGATILALDSGDGAGGGTLSALASLTEKWVAWTLDVNNGATQHQARWWTSDDGSAWTQLGTTKTGSGVTSIHAGTAPLNVSGINAGADQPFKGRIYDVSVRSGVGASGIVGGTEVFGIRATGIPDDTNSTFAAATGQTVTVNRSGSPDTELIDSGSTPGDPTLFLDGFFPIGVDLQPADTSTLTKWANRGVNMLIRSSPLDGDPTAWSAQVVAWNTANPTQQFKQIRHPRPTAANDIGLASLLAWSQRDEPDNVGAQIAPETCQAQYDAWKVIDPNRAVFIGVTGDMIQHDVRYYPANMPDGTTSHSEPWMAKYFAASDWIGADIFPANRAKMSTAATLLGDMTTKMHTWQSPERVKPIFCALECSDYDTTSARPGLSPTPAEMRGQMWFFICRGARGFYYFPERVAPTFASDATTAANAAEMPIQHARITALSAVLQGVIDPTGTSCVVTAPMEKCWRATSTHKYFVVLNFSAAARSNELIQVTGTGAATTAEVVGESRSVAISAGRITDTFGAYACHVYKVAI